MASISSRLAQKSYLQEPIKKCVFSVLSLAAAITIRESLGFEKTAIAVSSLCTGAGAVFVGLMSLILLHDKNDYFDENKAGSAIPKNAILGGAMGLAASLTILALFEASFQMLQQMKSYID